MKTRTALLAALCILASHGLANAKATYISFDPPGSAFTQPVQINAVGTVDGWYADSGGVEHGFLRTSDGTITSFDPTGSTGTYPGASTAAARSTASGLIRTQSCMAL